MINKKGQTIRWIFLILIALFVLIILFLASTSRLGFISTWFDNVLPGFKPDNQTLESVEILGYNPQENFVALYDGADWINFKEDGSAILGKKEVTYSIVHNQITNRYYFRDSLRSGKTEFDIPTHPLKAKILGTINNKVGNYIPGDVPIELEPKDNYRDRYRVGWGGNDEIIYLRFLNGNWEWSIFPPPPRNDWKVIDQTALEEKHFKFNDVSLINKVISSDIKDVIRSLIGKDLEGGRELILLELKDKDDNLIPNTFLVNRIGSSLGGFSQVGFRYNSRWEWSIFGDPWKPVSEQSYLQESEVGTALVTPTTSIKTIMRQLESKGFGDGKQLLYVIESDSTAPGLPDGTYILRFDNTLFFQEKDSSGNLRSPVPADSKSDLREINPVVFVNALVWRDSIHKTPVQITYTENNEEKTEPFCVEKIDPGLVIRLGESKTDCPLP